MTLEEQYEKETGSYSQSYLPGESYTDSYVDWLEEKLTWKKFSKQKPDVGSNILSRNPNTSYYGISQRMIDYVVLNAKESEWMYVPE